MRRGGAARRAVGRVVLLLPPLLLPLLAGAPAACGRAPGVARAADDAAAQGAALRALFRDRERAAGVVVWADRREPGPVFAALGIAGDAPGDAAARVLARASGLAVTRADAGAMERLFAAHPDGWAAFHAAHAGTAGLVEVGRVARAGDTAAVTVGRACGEQCRNAWRVVLVARPRGGAWRVADVRVLRVPR